MTNLTQQQYNSLTDLIYTSLMASDEMGLGEMGEAREEADRIVKEWCENNNIKLPE